MTSPSEFPPPVDSADKFIGPPTDPEDDRIEVGVAIVGGHQAGLACAIRLLQLLEDDPDQTEKLGEVPVAVLEKGKVAGAHQLSGAVMNPSAIRELLPDDDSWPTYGEVEGENVYFMLNRKRALPLKPRRRRSATTATTWSRWPSSTAGWPRRPRRRAPTS